MAWTVTGAFTEFLSRLEPTEKQKQDASTKRTTVQACLNEKLWVASSFLTGSYARSTLIRPPNDIDLFVVLDAEHHAQQYFHAWDGSIKVVERFHDILKGCYPTTPIRKDQPAVHLDFSTYGFDVIPAFDRQGGGYLILSRAKTGWISTNPTEHANRTTILNKATYGDFVPVVKMMKAWNRDKNFGRLTGFHLEVELGHAWPKVGDDRQVFSTYSAALAAIFGRLSSTLASTTNDPAGLSGRIDEYLAEDVRRWTRDKLVSASEGAAIARNHEAGDRMELAINKWRDILGDTFPAYGW
jgi:predicted nucleotidyltransferase